MASSSTSFVHKTFKYDVFLSFRGEDTRRSFVDHLYYALQQNGIHTYKDDERINKGKKISDDLIGSIEDSKLYIIVFSKNYASSTWCLDELVKIMECHKTNEHTAYPVFYDVEPSEVRRQSGAVEKAFADHENEEAAEKWRGALKEAADLAGWELKNTADRHEAKFIQKVVGEISLELRSINFSFDEKLVGMETRICDVLSSLDTSLNDVRMIGIKGMGGGGKTTLARAVFDQISFQFEGASFVENGISVSSVYDGKNKMKRRMPGKKVLLVLDDVDHLEQLEALAGETNWFKPGSRIIITTRDEQVLVAHGVKSIHNVVLLLDEEAICLFSKYAFGRMNPNPGYEELSQQVVHYAAGLPLTIKVLASFLCGKNELEWIDALERLKTIPLMETLQKLEISYISLEEDYKEIFLNVACILKGQSKALAIKTLESCGFHARNGLRVLEQKSLIAVNARYGLRVLGMHDHIEEMGKNIVRRSHPDKPYKHSRLWIGKELEDVLTNDLGTKATRYILFNGCKLSPEIVMKGLRKMKELRFLGVSTPFIDANTSDCSHQKWKFDKLNALRYMRWSYYPFRYLPKTFQGENLVALQITHSRMVQLWEGEERKVLHKLRFLEVRDSMLRTLDLGLTPNIETLNLTGCNELVEVHMHTECVKLISIELSCSMLRTLVLGSAPNLEWLYLDDCSDLIELQMPGRAPNLRYLQLWDSKLRTLDIGLTPNLEFLDLRNCHDLEKLYMADECQKLKSLYINCSSLRNFDLRMTPNLEMLDLKNCSDLEELHMANGFQKLTSLKISGSKFRNLDLRLTPNLKMLDLKNCSDLEELHMANGFQKLTSLKISGSKFRNLDLRLTPNLKTIDLKNCSNLLELHVADECLKKLVYLDLSGCLRFKSFKFEIKNDGSCRKDYSFCSHDEPLKVVPLANLYMIAESLDECPVHPENKFPKFQFLCLYAEDQPLFTRNLGNLISLGLCPCTNLEIFSRSICGLQHLRELTLQGSLPEVPKELDQLECLERLHLYDTNIKDLPDTICKLKHLESLNLGYCPLLEKLPDDLGRLECLKEITLIGAKIKDLPDSICMLKYLESLKLPGCSLLEKLPADLGHLECLENLELNHCRFLPDIPDSICKMKCLKYLCLYSCIQLEKLPEEFERLECLEKLDLRGTSIRNLPENIFFLKGLRIIGSRGLLQSSGFRSEIRSLDSGNFNYVDLYFLCFVLVILLWVAYMSFLLNLELKCTMSEFKNEMLTS
ncbi:unnamed protein product [Lactuca saligna]|uniref:TIR domain-containing protein n=1 Tax=Lactuca saligna TaxID=75948 RepID=A0AA36E6S7_LACSI|nr:unnamed protein product [Lactuca saligna]